MDAIDLIRWVSLLEARHKEIPVEQAVDRRGEELLERQAMEIDQLKVEREEQVAEMRKTEELLVTVKVELEEARAREEVGREQLEVTLGEFNTLKRIHQTKKEEHAEKPQTNNDLERDLFTAEIQRLKLELSMKEEEMRHLADAVADSREVKQLSGEANLSSSLIHDMSVDDRMIEESMTLSVKPLIITPSRRGPSASSTPQKDSIGEELRDMDESPNFPSPFCEKVEVEGHLKVLTH